MPGGDSHRPASASWILALNQNALGGVPFHSYAAHSRKVCACRVSKPHRRRENRRRRILLLTAVTRIFEKRVFTETARWIAHARAGAPPPTWSAGTPDPSRRAKSEHLRSHETRIAGQILSPISKIVRRYEHHWKRDAHPVLHNRSAFLGSASGLRSPRWFCGLFSGYATARGMI